MLLSLSVVPTLIYVGLRSFNANAFTVHTKSNRWNDLTNIARLNMAGGEGGDAEWAKALMDASGVEPGAFEKEMKMKGLLGGKKANPALEANKNLLSWLEQEGDVYLSDASDWAQAPHPLAISTQTIDETTNESTGRGLLARRDVSEGDELLEIPLKMCMTKLSARKSFGSTIIHDDLNEYLAISLQLINEYYMNDKKSWYQSYLEVLPRVDEVNPTFLWSDEDLKFLEGSPVISATKSLQLKLRIEYDTLLGGEDGLCNTYPKIFPKEVFTHEKWLWAFTQLFSRAVRLRSTKQGETLALVPYADLINHSPFSSAYLDAREIGSWLFTEEAEEVILYADRSYRKMEQIYISYGPKSNADLLLLYGFALERNPYNSVDVTVSIQRLSKQDDPLADQKIEFLKKVGRKTTVDFPCYFDRYPTEMLEYLRLMQMTLDDTKGKNIEDFDYSRTISAANEASVLRCIIDAVKFQLSKYPTSEDQDAALIQDKALFKTFNYQQRNAIRHRRNEKRLLKRTVAALEKQMKTRGLMDFEKLSRAGGNTNISKEEEEALLRKKGWKVRSALEERLDSMGLPIDLR